MFGYFWEALGKYFSMSFVFGLISETLGGLGGYMGRNMKRFGGDVWKFQEYFQVFFFQDLIQDP